MLLLSEILIAASCQGHLDNLPEGWVYLPEDCIDSSCGFYFDTNSGARLTYDIGFTFVVGKWAEGKTVSERDGLANTNISLALEGSSEKGCLILSVVTQSHDEYPEHAANYKACYENSNDFDRIAQL